jgi:ABC-type transporter Mla maintaining outer membrane lipid asymmetry ATPase subunit MlaF
LSAQDVDEPCAIERRATTDATAAVSVRNLRMGHGKRALRDSASFNVRRGEIVVIPGGSGSRNSSLMPAELRDTQPRRGHGKDAFCQLKFTLSMSMETISIFRMGPRSGPRV